VGVVVAHQGQARLAGQAQQVLVDRVLLRHVMLKLDEEARARPLVRKRRAVPPGTLDRLLPPRPVARSLVREQVLADLRAEVPVDRDEALGAASLRHRRR
jgi:hypothetical protein